MKTKHTEDQIRIWMLKGLPNAIQMIKNQVGNIKRRRDMLSTEQYDEMYATIEDVAREELGPDFNDVSMIEWLEDAKASEKLEIELLDETAGRLLTDAGLPATEWRKVDLLRRSFKELSIDYEDG